MYRILTVTLFSALIVLSSPAWAVTVTEGFLSTSVINDYDPDYNMSGRGFSLDCFDPRFCGFLHPSSSAGLLGAGDMGTPVSLNSRWGLIPFFAGSPANELVLNGTTYRAQGTLDMTVGQVLRAPTVTASFTMVGNLDLLHADTLVDVGDLTLTGRGTVTAFFLPVGTLNGIRFDFTSPDGNGGGPGVIPEPTTVLLLASGLAGLALRRRAQK